MGGRGNRNRRTGGRKTLYSRTPRRTGTRKREHHAAVHRVYRTSWVRSEDVPKEYFWIDSGYGEDCQLGIAGERCKYFNSYITFVIYIYFHVYYMYTYLPDRDVPDVDKKLDNIIICSRPIK